MPCVFAWHFCFNKNKEIQLKVLNNRLGEENKY